MLRRIVICASASVLTYSNSTSELRSDRKKSVIIGTGIVGLTTAYYLAKNGHQVICIERREDVALETRYFRFN